MAEQNERIIADLLKGSDAIDAEDSAVETRLALHWLKSRPGEPPSKES